MTERSDHPISFVDLIVSENPDVEYFEFGIYAYHPQTTKDTRKVCRASVKQLRGWFNQMQGNLSPCEEIAIHSRVYLAEEESGCRHIPMIDFMATNVKNKEDKICELLYSFGIKEYSIFRSGRSFHLYGVNLLDHGEWVRFMGEILLLNPPKGKKLVDTRWVGHRLLAGYGALRWTRNTETYKAIPHLMPHEFSQLSLF